MSEYAADIVQIDSVDSTLLYMEREALYKDAPTGTLVWTSNQFSGKGQGENRWESETGKNICLSMVLRPTFLNPSRQFMVTKILSLALVQVLAKYVDRSLLKVKWPNDLYVQDRKIAGILVHNRVLGSLYERALIGIGININQSSFSKEVPNPTSLTLQTGLEYELAPLVQEIHSLVLTYFRLLERGKEEQLDREYLQFLMNFGEWKNYRFQGVYMEAMIRGVDEYGHLRLETREGKLLEADLKELVYLRNTEVYI